VGRRPSPWPSPGGRGDFVPRRSDGLCASAAPRSAGCGRGERWRVAHAG